MFRVRPTQNAWHYRHQDSENGSNGCGGLETYIHVLAKLILEKTGWIETPPVTHRWKNGSQLQIRPRERFVFETVEIEPWIDGRRPDLRVTGRGERTRETKTLWIEVAVTHPCPEDKIIHIRQEGVTALEIDLSKLRGNDEEAVGRALLSGENRSWLHNLDLVKWQANEDAKLERRARVVLDAARIQDDLPPSEATLRAGSTLRALGLEDWIGLDVGPTPGLKTRLDLWQAKLLHHLLIEPIRMGQAPGPLRPLDGLKPLADDLAPELRGTFKDELREKLRTLNGGFFPTPFNVIDAYFGQLATIGVLTRDSTVPDAVVQDIRARLRRYTLGQDRLAGIRARVDMLLGGGSAEFDPDVWLDQPVMDGRSVRDLAHDDMGAWEALLAALDQVDRMKSERIPASSLLGLPLEDLLAITTSEANARKAERETEQALRNTRRADERARTLEMRATDLIGQKAAELWLSTPLLRGASPRSRARDDDDALERMIILLGFHADELAERTRRTTVTIPKPFGTVLLNRIRGMMTMRSRS